MKKVLLVLVALMATVCVNAQQIAVVNGSATKLYSTLKDAFEGAEDGSVVYLPGGGFPIADSDTIKKKMTIIGISHKINSDNADGCTTISGNLIFGSGSSGSAVMGCYVTGNVNIGDKNNIVNNVLMKYCNVNGVYVNNAACEGIEINQNYIRKVGSFSKASVKITNNIINYLEYISAGVIKNNNIVGGDKNGYSLSLINNSTILDNIIISSASMVGDVVKDCQINGNVIKSGTYGDESVAISNLTSVFVKYAGVSTQSDFHFNEDFKKTDDFKKCVDKGIYGGTGFSDGALPPVPYIQECDVDEQTDAEGKLRINIKVKAVTE